MVGNVQTLTVLKFPIYYLLYFKTHFFYSWHLIFKEIRKVIQEIAYCFAVPTEVTFN